jgi:tetratricopeptide (TPR) repeat protein
MLVTGQILHHIPVLISKNCTITNNTNNGTYCNSYSSAKYANPTTGVVHYGYNTVTNNNQGIFATNHSNVSLGDYQGGNNSINNNSGYEVVAEYSSIIPAQYNFWARPAPNYYDWNDFSTFVGSSIDPTHALSSPPSIPMKLASINTNTNSEVLQHSKGDKSSVSVESSTDTHFLDAELMQALEYLILCKYDKAISEYKQRLNTEENKEIKEYILVQLAECYLSSGEDGFIDFLNQNVRKNLTNNDPLYLLTLDLENGSLMGNRNYSKVIDNLNLIKGLVSNDKDAYKQVLFNLACFYYNVINDISNSKKYLLELESKYPNDELVSEVKLMLGVSNINALAKVEQNIDKPEDKVPENPASYSLLQNYPNPFNPSTTISYNLPRTSAVEIEIYDILGNAVKTFTISSQSAGRQNIIWNGTNSNNRQVASGIYLYHFKAVSLEGVNKTFEKTAKLLLLK